MSTRVLTGNLYTILGSGGVPGAYANAPVTIRLLLPIISDGGVVAPRTSVVLANASGELATELAVPDSGAAPYSISIPDYPQTIAASIAAGAALDLATIVAAGLTALSEDAIVALLASYATTADMTTALAAYILKTSLPLAGTSPTSGQVLTYNGTAWAPATPSGAALTWHVIGSAGEPAFGSGWANYGTGYPVAYALDSQWVYLRGWCFNGSASGGSEIFSISGVSVAYRQDVTTGSTTQVRTVAGANCSVQYWSGAKIPVMLDGVRFLRA